MTNTLDDLNEPALNSVDNTSETQARTPNRTLKEHNVNPQETNTRRQIVTRLKTGHLIHEGLLNYERLPMLEVVYDRLVKILAGNLRNLTHDNVDVALKEVRSRRFGECLEDTKAPSMFSVFEVKEWDNFGLISLEPDMIYSIVGAMMGGRQTSHDNSPNRRFTSIERNLVERFVRIMLSDLSTSFAPICDATFRFVRIESDPRFAMVARVSSASILAQLKITVGPRAGTINVILPYATIEPVRDILLQQFMGEKFGRDSIWESHLAEELRLTDVELEIVLEEQVTTLGTLMAMETGTVLPLRSRKKSPVTIRCGGIHLFEANPVNRHGNLAVVIRYPLPNTKEC